jgi:hypothetical protein
MCECIERVNEALKERNTKLALTFTFGKEAAAYPTIMTEIVVKVRGQRPATMLPSFCPFCGTRYHAAES